MAGSSRRACGASIRKRRWNRSGRIENRFNDTCGTSYARYLFYRCLIPAPRWKGRRMISRRTVALALASLTALTLPAFAKVAFDTDNDGTVDLAEAKKA